MEQYIKNAISSSRMEGLNPTDEDITLIEKFINNEITKEEFINTILEEVNKDGMDNIPEGRSQ